MELSEEELARIERLAMISVQGDSRARLGSQISRIIGFVRQLQDMDTETHEAGIDAAGKSPSLRFDEPADCLGADVALSQAPDSAGGMFRVPGILAGEDAEP